MIAALVLLAVGAGDAIRGHAGRRGWGIAALVWIALAAAALLGTTLPGGLILAAVAVAPLWSIATTSGRGDRAPRLWPALALLIVVAIAALVDSGRASVAGAIAQQLSLVTRAVALDQLALLVGAVLALGSTANIVVRAAIGIARRAEAEAEGAVVESTSAASSARRRWPFRNARPASAPVPASASAPALRGGRLIGPVERILITALVLVGGYPALAALVAAKGIVRFPEISGDRSSGAKAEEFLIGSLTSWLIAAAVAVLIVLEQLRVA